MTAHAATVDGLALLGLPEHEPDHVDHADPAGDAVEQAGHQTQVGAPAELIRRRIHQATLLSLIAAVQLIWIATLLYGLWILFA